MSPVKTKNRQHETQASNNSVLQEVRERALNEFKKRDDKWLTDVDPTFFGNKPTNNFCKWFHVCVHEANHRGQITVIRKRLSGKMVNNKGTTPTY